MAKDFTLKDIKKTIETKERDGDKVVKYDVEYENKDGKDKITLDDKKKGTKKVTAKKITKKVEGKSDEDVTDKSIEISYVNDGWFTHYGKIDKVAGKEPEKEVEVSFSGMNSFRPTTWILGVVVIIALVGGIWYWISSSKKEDKEEESL